MAKSAEVDDPSQSVAGGPATSERRRKGTVDAFGVPPLVKYKRHPELAEELHRWYALDEPARHEELKRAAEKRWSIETFLHVARQAWAAGDRRAYVKAFNAFSTRATHEAHVMPSRSSRTSFRGVSTGVPPPRPPLPRSPRARRRAADRSGASRNALRR